MTYSKGFCSKPFWPSSKGAFRQSHCARCFFEKSRNFIGIAKNHVFFRFWRVIKVQRGLVYIIRAKITKHTEGLCNGVEKKKGVFLFFIRPTQKSLFSLFEIHESSSNRGQKSPFFIVDAFFGCPTQFDMIDRFSLLFAGVLFL